jgi:hypothetical protein
MYLIARTGGSIADGALTTGPQSRFPRGDYCRGGRGERRKEQLRPLCIGYEELACRSFEQEEDVAGWVGLHCAAPGGRLDSGSIRPGEQRPMASNRTR